MIEVARTIAGVRTIEVCTDTSAHLAVVILHGTDMRPEDLSPFARSLGVAAHFYFPQGLFTTPSGRFAWMRSDQEARARARALGPMDLSSEHFADAPTARQSLVQFIRAVRAESNADCLALVGFSQGGMLACDTVLRESLTVDALALLSSCRISADEWEPLLSRLNNLPVFVAHGRDDRELAFRAGEILRDTIARGGARVTWIPFDGAHEIPLVVWRALRKFLGDMVPRT